MDPHATDPQATDPQADDAALRVRNLVRTFGEIRACDGIDLAVARGEQVGLVGRSGSGKSTLLRHVNALERPNSGTVEVFGTDASVLRGPALRRMRSRVGVVFQRFNLIGRLTVLENVLTGALGRVRWPRYGIITWPRALRDEAIAALERVGLADRAYERAGSLSGGQQQRVGISRMLMQRPELVLADEPVSSLDPETADAVLDMLVGICRQDGLTMICTLHQIDLALAWTRRVVALRNGRVVLDAPTDRLDAAGLRAVYGDEPSHNGERPAMAYPASPADPTNSAAAVAG